MVVVMRRLPDVAVIVTMEAPVATEFVAVSVSLPPPVGLVSVKDAVTPAGNPEAARVTGPLKPFCGVMAMVVVFDPPVVRVRSAGVAEIVNAEVAVIVSARRAVLARLPEVPVTVMVDVPAAAELPAISVSTLEVMALAGLKDAVTPAGNPDTVRFTGLLKPCCGLTVMVLVPLAPAAIDNVEADEDSPKPGAFDVPARLLIKGWPAGLPQPVARS